MAGCDELQHTIIFGALFRIGDVVFRIGGGGRRGHELRCVGVRHPGDVFCLSVRNGIVFPLQQRFKSGEFVVDEDDAPDGIDMELAYQLPDFASDLIRHRRFRGIIHLRHFSVLARHRHFSVSCVQ